MPFTARLPVARKGRGEIMTRIDDAIDCFTRGFCCSQAVISSYCDMFGLDRDLACRVSGPFGVGMGRMCETCEAVTGAFMVIGLKYGRASTDDISKQEKSFAKVQEFSEAFRKKNGSIVCRELMGYDMGTPEGLQYARENHLRITNCTNYVRDAAEILERIL
jgi:C_GCAxxG_C_C family probable redox protein